MNVRPPYVPPPTALALRSLAQEQNAAADERFIDRLRTGIGAVTPTLLFTAIGTGFALAIGTGLGAAFMRYILPDNTGRPARRSRR